MKRRDAIKAAGGAAIGTLAGCAKPSAKDKGEPPAMVEPSRMPAIYLPHGGGPWPFVELPMFVKDEVDALAGYLRAVPRALPAKPKALLVISAHWEEAVPTVMTHERPAMFYDYYGFPDEAYRLTWPAPGHPQLAARVQELLRGAGMAPKTDDRRGFDHGTFIPLMVMYPEADIPTVQLSMLASLDPAAHIALGRALAPLRDEGVLLIGSGMSYHDLRGFFQKRARAVSEAFDGWLSHAACDAPEARNERLLRWHDAPSARAAHPREEHLLPLMVIAGAAGSDRGRTTFSGRFGDARISAYQYG